MRGVTGGAYEVETSDTLEREPTFAIREEQLQPDARRQLVVAPQMMERLRATDERMVGR